MRDTVFLVVNMSGVSRMTKRPPTVARSERVVKVSVDVPDSVFVTAALAVNVVVPAPIEVPGEAEAVGDMCFTAPGPK